VLPGMEITSAEEVHVLGLFPRLEAAEEVGANFAGFWPRPTLSTTRLRRATLLADDGAKRRRDGHPRLATPLDLNETVRLINDAEASLLRPTSIAKPSRFLAVGLLPTDAGFDGSSSPVKRRASGRDRSGHGPGPAGYQLFRQSLLGGDRVAYTGLLRRSRASPSWRSLSRSATAGCQKNGFLQRGGEAVG